MHSLGIGKTDIGVSRSRNEDALLVDNDLGLYVVCDGMGGHAAGDVAAATTVEAIGRIVRDRRSTIHHVRTGGGAPGHLTDLLKVAVERACAEVYRLAAGNPRYSGMGCAVTVVLVAGRQAAMAHVGDTRLYLCRDGSAHQLSTDHTMVHDMLRQGMIDEDTARAHPYRNILTRAVGIQEAVQVDTLTFDVLAGDRLLLCSDGLTHYLSDEDIARESSGDFESAPEAMIDIANQGGGGDNITAIAVRVQTDHDERPLAIAWRQDVEVKIEALSSVFMFEDLTLAQLARVLNACELISYSKGDTVIGEGEPCSRLLVSVEGRFAIEHGGSRIAELVPGDWTGESTMLRRRPSRASLRTLEDGRMLSLEGEALKALAQERPWLGVALLEKLCRRLSLDAEGTRPTTGESDTASPETLATKDDLL